MVQNLINDDKLTKNIINSYFNQDHNIIYGFIGYLIIKLILL